MSKSPPVDPSTYVDIGNGFAIETQEYPIVHVVYGQNHERIFEWPDLSRMVSDLERWLSTARSLTTSTLVIDEHN